jgi:acetyl-CoA C-acetyltransferase
MDAAIIGVGMHPFGRHDGVSELDMGAVAVREALKDAGVEWPKVQFAFGGSYGTVLHGSAMPDALVGRLGLTGVPFTNVTNACATGGSALSLAAATVTSGQFDIGVAVGFDKHPRGHFNLSPEGNGIGEWYGESGMMVTTQYFALKINRYLHEHGISPDVLASVSAKNFANGALTPHAWRRKALMEEEVQASAMLNYPLTQYMFCSPCEGAAAAIVCRADIAHLFTDRPIYIRGTSVRTRRYGSFEVFSPSLAGERADSPTVDAAMTAYEMAGLGPEDVDVAQLQDTDAGAEVIHMAEAGFCKHGEQEELIRSGATKIGGRLPINTDGGLLANGEPIGASGLRQVHELVQQLRGTAGDRQVPDDPRVGFSQVYGVPGTAATVILSR